MKIPYEIPPFDPGKMIPKVRYDWWGWHPLYPYWSRTCWGGATEQEARRKTDRLESSVYAMKLVRQEGAVFTVIDEFGPTVPGAWERFKVSETVEAQP